MAYYYKAVTVLCWNIDSLGEGVGTDEGELGLEKDVEADSDHDDSLEGVESVSVVGTESTILQLRPTVAKETQKAGRKRRKEDCVENILKSRADSEKRYTFVKKLMPRR